MSHQQLYELAHTGDPGRLFAAGDHWHKINANMAELHADLTQALAELAHCWQGPAADVFQQKGQAIGAKIQEAATRSQNLGDGLHQMGQALGEARARMPEPPSGLERLVENLAGGAGKGTVAGTIGGGPLGAALGAIGGGMLDDHIKSQHAEAVRVMRHLGAQYTEAIKRFEYPQADDEREREAHTHNLPSAPEGETGGSAGHSGARGAPFSAGPSADSGYASGGSSEPYRPHGGGTSTHLADFSPPTVSHGGNQDNGYPVSPETGYPTPPFRPGSGGGPVRPPQDGSWRPVDGPPTSGGDPVRLPSRRGFGPLPGGGERGPAGGFGGGKEGVFGGRASGGHVGAGPIGSDGVSGGQATTARMPASEPATGQQPHASQNMAAAGTREGEPGMPMPPGGIGSASGEERKRGQRPSYLREDPATWDLIGPYNPPVIE